MKEAILNLTDEVRKNKEVTASAVAAITGLKSKLDDAIAHAEDNDGDLSELEALSEELDAQTNDLASAIAETPAPAAQ